MLTCSHRDCASEVTHIDNKGFIYCRTHGEWRKAAGPCRKMTRGEVRTLEGGGVISYRPKRARKPDPADECESAAEWCAVRGLKGSHGDALPTGLSVACKDAIDADIPAFEERVRAYAYERAMRGVMPE